MRMKHFRTSLILGAMALMTGTGAGVSAQSPVKTPWIHSPPLGTGAVPCSRLVDAGQKSYNRDMFWHWGAEWMMGFMSATAEADFVSKSPTYPNFHTRWLRMSLDQVKTLRPRSEAFLMQYCKENPSHSVAQATRAFMGTFK